MKKFLYITVVFVVLFISVDYLKSVTLGKKPKLKEKELSKHLSSVSLNNYPKLDKAYKEIDFEDNNIDIVKVNKLKSELKKSYEAERLDGKSGRSLAFYYLDVLLKMRSINPKDASTIVELGDLSFERRVFSKAKEYYIEYLKLNDKDIEVRGRLASAYTFLGKFDLAILELDRILSKNPKHFQALAYKAIALSQKNEIKNAIAVGELALENAPTDEAYTRFGSYLEKLKNSENTTLLENYFKNNSVTKNKFLRIEENDKEAKVYLKDFPINNMPSFAKEKFIENIKKNADKKSKVTIIDTTSKEELIINLDS